MSRKVGERRRAREYALQLLFQLDLSPEDVARAAEDSGVPVLFGVLTAESPEQATDRSGGKHGNRGWEAALAAIETANVLKRLEAP